MKIHHKLFAAAMLCGLMTVNAFAMDEHLARNVQYAKEGQIVVINETLGDAVKAGDEVIVVDDEDASIKWKGVIHGPVTDNNQPTGRWTVMVQEKM